MFHKVNPTEVDGVIKSIYIYNTRHEHSHTIVIHSQEIANGISYVNKHDFGQDIHNSNRQSMSLLNYELWFKNQWVNIVYIQGSLNHKISGYYTCTKHEDTGAYHLFLYPYPLAGMLKVIDTVRITVIEGGLQACKGEDHISNNPALAYDNYYRDLQTRSYFNCSYEEYITQIIDKIIQYDDLNYDTNADQLSQKANCEEGVNTDNLHIIDRIRAFTGSELENVELNNKIENKVVTDFNYLNKKFGYLTQVGTDFSFTGPDREPVEIFLPLTLY